MDRLKSMKANVRRVLYIGVSPTQNSRPYILINKAPDVQVTVLWLEHLGDKGFLDPELITQRAFDHDLLSGYSSHFIKNASPFKKKKGFFFYISFDVWRHIKKNDFIVLYGHNYFTFWIAVLASKIYRKKLVFGTDATSCKGNAESLGWKIKLKPCFLRWLYNCIADAVFVPSTASRLFLESLSITPERIVLVPYAVDEEMIASAISSGDTRALRQAWMIPLENIVFIFCAKFIDRKRPLDAIEAFAKISSLPVSLFMIGDGPLKSKIERRIKELGLEYKIILPGIVKYSELPLFYAASNALVFCSDHEPYGLPVNEAMLCVRPVIISDSIGARFDLVEQGKTGWVYQTGNVQELSEVMKKAALDANALMEMGKLARKKMTNWSSQTNANAQLEYFCRTIEF